METHKNLVDYLETINTPVPSVTPIPTISTLLPTPKDTLTPYHLVFQGEVYVHSQGLFEFPLPDGWTLSKEQEGTAEFNNPSEGISLYVITTNTGLALDKASFQRFVEAQEVNLFSAYPGYLETERQYDQVDNAALVVKNLIFKGENQQVTSFYRQSGESVLNLDIWLPSELSKEYIDEFKLFFEKISLFPDEISTQPVYRWVYEFYSDDGHYTGLVPLQWTREHASTDTAQIDRFISPDQQAAVQLTLYNDGGTISKKNAGYIVLVLLHQEYDPDLTIIEDQLPPEGEELLVWKTTESGINGVTRFEIKDTTLKIITRYYLEAQEKVYQDLIQMISESIHAIE